MNIGIDIHGVIQNCEVYEILSQLKDQFPEINYYIISGAPVNELISELSDIYTESQLKLFSGYYSIIQHLWDNYYEGTIFKNSKGWWYQHIVDQDDIGDITWWTIKSEIAEKYNIQYVIDDNIRYKQGFLNDSNFILYTPDIDLKSSIRNMINGKN